MRDISDAMKARLAAETTSLCHCWKIIRRDGVVIGFTDHDADLAFGGVTYAASNGLFASMRDERLGLAAGRADVTGALCAFTLDETALASGLYDGASLETWLVDWAEPTFRTLLNIDTIGDVRRGEHAFTAELRSLAHVLEEETGRRYLKTCSADLGDARCGVDLATPAFRAEGLVSAAPGAGRFSVSVGVFSDRWFTGGRCHVLTGAQAGARASIRAHRQSATLAQIALWTPLAQPLAIGDRVELLAGCDKSFATCGDKFANRVNFRGFPHIPGNDVLMMRASVDAVMDGGSLFR